MYNGSIVESAKIESVINNPTNDYTKFLLRAQSLKFTEEEIYTFHKNYEQD